MGVPMEASLGDFQAWGPMGIPMEAALRGS